MRTEKSGVLIYYKHLKILEEAQLTDEQIGQILRAAIKYDETGECPKFSGHLSAFYTMIKYDLDANREKWELIKEERSIAGKKGGRPPKKAYEPIGIEESKVTNWLLGDAEDIKNESKNNGLFIDNSIVRLFSNCKLNLDWLKSPHSFLEFAAERVEENYGDKPVGEKKALFIDAVKNWEELRDEYPGWKSKKERHEQEAIRKMEMETVRKNHPLKCEYCGGNDLQSYGPENYYCNGCGAVCSFNTEKIKWEWRK
jgi:hypothetical protein